jgi:NAD(P)-dependent dehydrogenase (short-subunit alcohol dehydrogenase family)
MQSFAGKLAVVTGGGSGMGRELVVQLAAAGASVATCDLNVDTLDDTLRRAHDGAPSDVLVTAHACDVSNEQQVERFRDEVVAQHATDHLNLLFNNAGIGGGGSFITADRAEWERTFNVCWGGVYHCCRAFVPLLIASEEGYLVNTSSVNGFWASLGPGVPHTAYSTAKFAVKGFSEALLEDFRVYAPHVKVAVVMPGHIGTDIVSNSRRAHGASEPHEMTAGELDDIRRDLARRGMPAEIPDDALRSMIHAMGEGFRDNAPLSAADAATIILDGVRAGAWRILVGDDAHALDERVRADPLSVYGRDGANLASITRNAPGAERR